jgi:archaellum component FlaG (FlaF/FlaG flagellin family)
VVDTATVTVEEDQPAAGQVSISNVTLSPAMVDSNTTNEHTLTFDVSNVSDDGSADTLTLTFPDGTLVSSGSISAVDANGDAVALNPGTVDNDTVTVDFVPNTNATTLDITVTVENATVAAPSVTNATDVSIGVDWEDSANGNASASATLTVQPVDQADSPLDLVQQDGSVSFPEVLGVIEGFNGDGTYSQDGQSVQVSFPDVLSVIEAFNA